MRGLPCTASVATINYGTCYNRYTSEAHAFSNRAVLGASGAQKRLAGVGPKHNHCFPGIFKYAIAFFSAGSCGGVVLAVASGNHLATKTTPG